MKTDVEDPPVPADQVRGIKLVWFGVGCLIGGGLVAGVHLVIDFMLLFMR